MSLSIRTELVNETEPTGLAKYQYSNSILSNTQPELSAVIV